MSSDRTLVTAPVLWNRILPFLFLLFPLSSGLLVWGYMKLTGGPIVSEQLRSIAPFVANVDPGSEHIANYVRWQISGLFFTLSVIASVVFAGAQLVTYHDVKRSRKLMAGLVTFLALLLYVVLSGYLTGISTQVARLLYADHTDDVSHALVGKIDYILTFTQALTIASFSSLALAAFTIVDSLVNIDISCVAVGAKQLERNAHRLRILVFIGSALLFSGLIGVYASVAWRASLLDSAGAAHVTNLGKVIVLVWVGAWTVCLLLIYLSTALILRSRVYELADACPDRERLFKQYGLQLSFSDLLIKAFAILGPIITTVLPLKELVTVSD